MTEVSEKVFPLIRQVLNGIVACLTRPASHKAVSSS